MNAIEDKYLKEKSNFIIPDLGLYPKNSQGIAFSVPFISQVSQMQLLQNKLNALKSQRKTDQEFANQYLYGNYIKFLRYPQLVIIKQKPPTQREIMKNNILKLKGYNLDGSAINNKLKNFQYENDISKLKLINCLKETENNDKSISTSQNKINPQLLFELQGDCFKLRTKIGQIRNSISDIKETLSQKIKAFEAKQNMLLQHLRSAIILGGSNKLQAVANNVYDKTKFNLNDIKEELPKYYQEAVDLIDKKVIRKQIQ